MSDIQRITNAPKHHLFGFHDICAWNANNDRLVALEIDEINTPPNPDIEHGLGYVDNENNFILFGTTRTFNYPQGARQQWIGKTNNVIVNDIKDKKVISKIYDTNEKKLLDILEFPTHIITNKGWAFGINYARLFRLGAYGYAGAIDHTIGDNFPKNDGIIKHNIYTKENELLLSIKEISEFQNNPQKGKHHYITHLVLSPNEKRIAFLHRCKLNDGGEMTRLCTIGIDGKNLRCLASGFLSHFDWIDNDHIMIWGRIGSNVEKLRNSLLYQLIPIKILREGKKIVKKITDYKQKNSKSLFNWNNFEDRQEGNSSYIAEHIITEDGHPMFCPTNRDWLICDNYPNKSNGVRTLYLYNIVKNEKIVLGQFKRLFDKPNLNKSRRLLEGTDLDIFRVVGLDNFAFSRSGLHCDLHPRWSPNGEKVAFDSIHEGTRQIYMINVKDLIK